MRKIGFEITTAAIGLTLAVMVGMLGSRYADQKNPSAVTSTKILLSAAKVGSKNDGAVLPEIKGALQSASTIDPLMLVEGTTGDGQISNESFAALAQRQNTLSANRQFDAPHFVAFGLVTTDQTQR